MRAHRPVVLEGAGDGGVSVGGEGPFLIVRGEHGEKIGIFVHVLENAEIPREGLASALPRRHAGNGVLMGHAVGCTHVRVIVASLSEAISPAEHYFQVHEGTLAEIAKRLATAKTQAHERVYRGTADPAGKAECAACPFQGVCPNRI